MKRSTKILAAFAFLLGVVCVSYEIPPTLIGEKGEVPFYGNWIAWQKFFIFEMLVFCGYLYVADLNGRKNPFLSRSGSKRQIIQLMCVSPVIFFLVPIRTIHSLTDGENFAPLNLGYPSSTSEWSSISYNYIFYALPFFLGLHYRLLDDVQVLNRMFYSITWPPIVEKYGRLEYTILAAILILGLGLVGFHFYLFAISGLWLYYLPILIGSIILVVILLRLLRRTHYLHLHHYFIFGSLALLTPFQNPITAFTQATLFGIAVEGYNND